MRIRLLGTAAGGGFPQWNCGCVNCCLARAEPARAWPRSQCGAAVSADGRRWFLLNASPDLPAQIQAFPPLLPDGVRRGTAVEGILLTSADLDCTLGLLLLREGERLTVHAPAAVRQAVNVGLRIDRVLACYCGVEWRLPPAEPAPLLDRRSEPTGIRYAAFPVPGQPPRYHTAGEGGGVGYRLEDEGSGARLVFLPGVAEWTESIQAQVQDCDALLLDGTFWAEDEMQRLDVGSRTASAMGHLPVGGPHGSLMRIAALRIPHRIYVHVNNTNPLLIEDSAERRAVEAVGAMVGWDGLELSL